MVFNEFLDSVPQPLRVDFISWTLNPAPVRISIYFASPTNQHFGSALDIKNAKHRETTRDDR